MSRTGRVTIVRMTGELLVIFVGVSLSFLANDWGEQRAARNAAEQILDGIASDLQADIPQMREQIAGDSVRTIWATWLVKNWDTEADAARVSRALSAQHRGGTYSQVRSSYDSAKNSGTLANIEDEALRVALTRYYEETALELVKTLEIDNSFRFKLWDAWGPVLRSDFGEGSILTREMVLTEPWPNIRGDGELRNAVENGLFFAELSEFRMRSFLKASEELFHLIEEK